MDKLYQLVEDAKEELKDEVLEHGGDIDDLISEIADSSVPIYYGDIIQMAADNLDLATDVPELGPAFGGEATPCNIIAANIYEHISNALYGYKDELEELLTAKEELEEA